MSGIIKHSEGRQVKLSTKDERVRQTEKPAGKMVLSSELQISRVKCMDPACRRVLSTVITTGRGNSAKEETLVPGGTPSRVLLCQAWEVCRSALPSGLRIEH